MVAALGSVVVCFPCVTVTGRSVAGGALSIAAGTDSTRKVRGGGQTNVAPGAANRVANQAAQKAPALDNGKGKEKSKNPLIRLPKRNLRSGKGMRCAHVKDGSAAKGAMDGAPIQTKPAQIALGSCRFGDSCKDLHGGPEQGKGNANEKGKGKGGGRLHRQSLSLSAEAEENRQTSLLQQPFQSQKATTLTNWPKARLLNTPDATADRTRVDPR